MYVLYTFMFIYYVSVYMYIFLFETVSYTYISADAIILPFNGSPSNGRCLFRRWMFHRCRYVMRGDPVFTPPKTNISELGKGETSTNYQFSGSILVFGAYSKVQK